MLTRGSSWAGSGEEEVGEEGLERRSMRGRGAGVSSMRSESGMLDMLIEQMVGGEIERMAAGWFL